MVAEGIPRHRRDRTDRDHRPSTALLRTLCADEAAPLWDDKNAACAA